MKEATLDQAAKILALFKDTPSEQVQDLLESGFLADLRDGNIADVNRDEFRRLVGLEPLFAPREWQVWKTITLGTHKDADAIRQALKANGCRISNYGNDILGKPAFSVAHAETELDLVTVSVAQLGFKKGATRKDIYARALQLGLELCPAEVGPQLRLQHKDQPRGEWLLIGMEPITDSGGDLDVFGVFHGDDGLWLDTFYGSPDYFWRSFGRWVFVLPRK